jgi:beta-lactamase regulating signal transducer with metallopeptidase domain/Leucine-rich repeat (LRR) protein
MNAILDALRHPLAERLGWGLIHLVWQGAAVALLLAGLLWLLRRRSANARYMCAGISLLLLPLALAMTVALVPGPVRPASADQTPKTSSAIVANSRSSVAERNSRNAVEASTLERIASQVEPPQPAAVGSGIRENSGVQGPDGRILANSATAAVDSDAPTATRTLEASGSLAPNSSRPPLRRAIAERVEPALPWVVAGWLAGLLALSVWHLGGWLALRRLRRRGVTPVSDSVHNLLNGLCRRLGIRRRISVLQSSRVSVPSLLGWLKPVVLLPGSVLTGLTPWQLEAVLAHELAHVRRHDYLVNLLQTAIETLLFFHPAVWWISRRIRIERENCCDDVALSVTGDRLQYAKTLARVEELRHQTPTARPAALMVAAVGGSLLDRVGRVLGVPQRSSRSRVNAGSVAGLSGLLSIAAALVLMFAPATMSQAPANLGSAAVAPGDDDVPSTRLGDLTVLQVVPIADLKPGATVSLGNGNHRFDKIPDFLKGRRFTRRNGYLGILKFRVEKAQRVYFAVYGADWGGGGNPSGGWRKELVTRKQLEKQGWKEVGKLVGEHTVRDGNRLAWIVFARDCKAGETFAIRTHKYQAPILFSAKKGAEQKQVKGGTPVNGLRLTLTADKTETVMKADGSNAERVKLRLTFTNVSDKPIKLHTYRFPFSHLTFDATGPEPGSLRAVKNPIPISIPYLKPVAGHFPVIQPGKSSSSDLVQQTFPGRMFQKDGWIMNYIVRKTGTYKLRYTYENQNNGHLALAKGSWTGRIQSNELELKVLPHNSKETVKEDAKSSVSTWGNDQNGLQIRVKAPARIEQGLSVKAEIQLRCNPKNLTPGTKRLNEFLPAAFLEMSLKNVASGKTLSVRPFDPTQGMPVGDQGKYVQPLNGKPLKPWHIQFPLVRVYDSLTWGDYECQVRFSFPKQRSPWWRGTPAQWQAAGFWDGTLASGVFRLKVTKQSATTKTILLPKRLRTEPANWQGRRVTAVVFKRKDAEKVTVKVRNGHVLGWKMGSMLAGGLPQPDGANWIDLWLKRPKEKEVSYTIEVFETPHPATHFWRPEQAGYRVIWKKTFTVQVPQEDNGEKKTGSARPAKIKAVYLVRRGKEKGQFSVQDLKQHPDVLEVHTFAEFARQARASVALWVDTNAVGLVNPEWLRQEPQLWYPLAVIGYCNATYAFHVKLRPDPVPFRGPRGVKLPDWTKVKLTPGFSTWHVSRSGQIVLRGYDGRPTVARVLKVTNALLKQVLKQVKSPKDRGTLHDAYQHNAAGKPTKRDELQVAPPIDKLSIDVDLETLFEVLKQKRIRFSSSGNTWLLFRSKQLDDNDVEWIERVERSGNEFTVTLRRAIWDGPYKKNITFHDLFGINLGKLPAGKYTVKWIIRRSRFLEFDKHRWPKGEKPAKPVELNTSFRVVASRTSAISPGGKRLQIKKSMKGPWKDAKVRVFRVGRKTAQLVAAKRAIWKLSAEGRSWKRSVIAFVGPSCGLPWVGLEQDGYLDTGTAVSGFHTIGGRINWHESIVKKDGKAKARPMAAILAAFDRDVTVRELEAFNIHPSHETPFNQLIKNPWMFSNGKYNSQPASPRITGGQFDGKSLKLGLTDVTGKFKATVWIDIKSRKVTKVEEETDPAVKGSRAAKGNSNTSHNAVVAAIKRLGGQVTFDASNPDRPATGVKLTGPHFIDDHLKLLKGLTSLKTLDLTNSKVTDAGLAHLKSVKTLQTLDLTNTHVTDAGLAHLKALRGLQELHLTHAAITDAGLKQLAGMVSLQGLYLYGTKLTDAGLVHLKGLPRLKTLILDHTQVTDAGLLHLKKLTSLNTLSLYLPQVTDAGLVHLKGLTKLKVLNLGATRVSDAGLVHLKGLTNLKRLELTYAPITDAGLVHLKGLKSLEILSLASTRVTDAGMTRLYVLPKLRTLYVSRTRVSHAGVIALQTALPDCHVDHQWLRQLRGPMKASETKQTSDLRIKVERATATYYYSAPFCFLLCSRLCERFLRAA